MVISGSQSAVVTEAASTIIHAAPHTESQGAYDLVSCRTVANRLASLPRPAQGPRNSYAAFGSRFLDESHAQ